MIPGSTWRRRSCCLLAAWFLYVHFFFIGEQAWSLWFFVVFDSILSYSFLLSISFSEIKAPQARKKDNFESHFWTYTHTLSTKAKKKCIYLRWLCNRNYTKPIILYVEWHTALLSLAWYVVVFMFFDVLFMFLLIYLASLTTTNWPTSADCSVCVLFWKCFGVSSFTILFSHFVHLIFFLFSPQIPG